MHFCPLQPPTFEGRRGKRQGSSRSCLCERVARATFAEQKHICVGTFSLQDASGLQGASTGCLWVSLAASWVSSGCLLDPGCLHDSFFMVSSSMILLHSFLMIPPPGFLLHDFSMLFLLHDAPIIPPPGFLPQDFSSKTHHPSLLLPDTSSMISRPGFLLPCDLSHVSSAM